MKSKVTTAEKDLMEIILDHFLFGGKGWQSDDNNRAKIQYGLLSAIKKLDKDPEQLIVFLETFITELLQDRLIWGDLVEIVRIYQDSSDHLIIQRLVDRQKKLYSFKFQNFPINLTDLEIANTLVVRRFVPVHIFTFLLNRFLKVIAFLNVDDNKKISVEQYQFLLAVYKDYYDAPDLIKITSCARLLCDRSHNNFFTEQDAEDYKMWIRSEIDKQPKYTIKLN